MRFLLAQMIIVILVCVFIAALSNLTELGAVGWIIAGSTGHCLFKIYRLMYNSFKAADVNARSQPPCNNGSHSLSRRLESFMFDDATGVRDD